MATKKSSKRTTRKALRTLKPQGLEIIAQEYAKPRTQKELAEIGRRWLEIARQQDEQAHARQERQRRTDEAIAREKREGIALKGARLDHAKKLINGLNASAYSAHDLATSALCTTELDEQAAMLVGIQNMMALCCRRCDVLAEYLGDGPGFGNFLDDVQAITEAEAARLEAEREAA